MSANNSKSVSIERVFKLIECYGANAEAWPAEERVSAMALLQGSAELQQRLGEATECDDFLNLGNTEFAYQARGDAGDVQKIIEWLPEQLAGELPAKLSMQGGQRNKKYAMPKVVKISNNTRWFDGLWNNTRLMAAGVAVMVVVVFMFQSTLPINSETDTELVQHELDQWIWEEVIDVSQNDNEEELTFMAFVELE